MSKKDDNLKYRDFTLSNGKIFPNVSGGKNIKKLTPGSYSLKMDMNGKFWFESFDITSDIEEAKGKNNG